MNATTQLAKLGQCLWLDNISRDLLDSGTLKTYIDEYSVTGLTSNPTIFDNAIRSTTAYDDTIHKKAKEGLSGEALFFDLALTDLKRAALLFKPIHDATSSMDGWVSLEVSPLLVHNAAGTIIEAARLHTLAQCANLLIKIPGTVEGNIAIEESIFAGVPINVTLLFSNDQYVAAAEAYMRGIERRIAAGLNQKIASVASIFVSRWDAALTDTVSPQFQNRLGIAMAMRIYKTYCALYASARWQALLKAGAQPQRLLWASTGTKDPTAADTLYVEALAATNTINTLPEKTLKAFADHGSVDAVLPTDGGHAEVVLEELRREGVDVVALAQKLQDDGAQLFKKSWEALLIRIAEKSAQLNGRSQT
jgi:transaldolase